MKKKIEELNKLKSLLEEGLIEQDEFEILKAEILGKDNLISDVPIVPEIKEQVIKPSYDNVKVKPPYEYYKNLHMEEEAESKVSETSVPPAVKESITVKEPLEEVKKPQRKKKNFWITLLFAVLGVSIIVIGVLIFNKINTNSEQNELVKSLSNIDKPKIVATSIKYVIAGNINLIDEPSELGAKIATLEFGQKIEVVDGTEQTIDNRVYIRAIWNGINGWINLRVNHVNLLDNHEKLNQIYEIVKGPHNTDVLKSVPAYAKIALIEYAEIYGGIINIDTSDNYAEIGFYRSSLRNRRSRKDKEKGINIDLKDMVFLSSNSLTGKQEIVVMSFDNKYKWTVLQSFPQLRENIIISGFERVKRRTSISAINGSSDYINGPIIYDAMLVRTIGSFNYYLYSGTQDHIRVYTSIANEPISMEEFNIGLEDNGGPDCNCLFTEPFDSYSILDNYILFESGETGESTLFFTPTTFMDGVFKQQFPMFTFGGMFTGTLAVTNEIGSDGMSNEVYPKTCIIEGDTWKYYGGGR